MKLSKQQKRRIAANLSAKIKTHDKDAIAVVVSHLGYQLVLSYHGKLISADWRKQMGDIACNDRVIIRQIDEQHAVVEAILPREKTLFKWQGRKTKPLAAHVDQLLILIAPVPAWQESLIDRYLIAAEQAGITPALLVNKTDCLDPESTAALEKRLAPYKQLGVTVFYSALMSAAPPDALLEWLNTKQTILCGQSGVGKSTLVKAIKRDADIWVQAISAATQLGRHTTTNLRRYPLENTLSHIGFHFQKDSAIIDTPGVRGFAISHLERADILRAFPDITHYAYYCRFNDCRHENTPHCAVQKALEDGEISAARFNSLQQLLSEVNL